MISDQAREGEIALAVPASFSDYIVDGVVKPLPTKPTPHHTFDYATKQWYDPRTLADFKTQQWDTIKRARSAAEYAGFTWDGSTFDSDAISQNRITGAVTLATLNSAFSIGWTLADNTARTLTATDMMAVGGALGTHVATQFAIGQALRAEIEAATDRAGVEDVVWPVAPA